MMRFTPWLAWSTMAMSLSLPPGASPQDVATGRIPTVSRLVQVFSRLELELTDAASRGDAAVLDRLVADDFETRSARAPGVPTPRAEWLAAARDTAPHAPSEMAVRALGDVAIVSFRMGPVAEARFVVDVWTQTARGWRVVARYEGGPTAGP
jgi:Domain of unknown function (DUF4440)